MDQLRRSPATLSWRSGAQGIRPEDRGKERRLVWLGLLLLLGSIWSPARAGEGLVAIGRFAEKELGGWQEKQFAGQTRYVLVADQEKGWVLKAQSKGTASGLVKQGSIDIDQTPYLNWSWKVTSLPAVADEKTKEGDDYPARIYVIFKTGRWFWTTRAVNYVWNSTYPPGATWPNAFTDNACMIAVQAGKDRSGVWLAEKRNIKQDILNCFGVKVSRIGAVALMTDSDNSADEATAYYGDIFFSSE
jgi:hypothetical protein